VEEEQEGAEEGEDDESQECVQDNLSKLGNPIILIVPHGNLELEGVIILVLLSRHQEHVCVHEILVAHSDWVKLSCNLELR